MSDFGPRMRARRERAGLSAESLARLVGCHGKTIRRFERGMRQMTPSLMRRIASVLNIKTGGDDACSEQERRQWERFHDALSEFF